MGISSVEAIVVLGGRLRFGEGGRLTGRMVGAVARRAHGAASLYRERGGGIVVASGGCAWDGVVEADAIAEELRLLGVRREDIVRERLSISTSDNARYVAIALMKRGIDRAVVVTCDWHVPRAVRAFEREGITARGHGVPGARRGAVRDAWRTVREHVAARIDRWR